MKKEPYRENARDEEVPWEKTKRDAIRIWLFIFGVIVGVVPMHFYNLRFERQAEPTCSDSVVDMSNAVFKRSCDSDQTATLMQGHYLVCQCTGKKK